MGIVLPKAAGMQEISFLCEEIREKNTYKCFNTVIRVCLKGNTLLILDRYVCDMSQTKKLLLNTVKSHSLL